MKASILFASAAATAPALALPQFTTIARRTNGSVEAWQAPGPGDVRGPCPGLNTLANHHYLPHHGKDVTLQQLRDAMLAGFNIENGDADLLFPAALATNPDALAETFSLDDLGREGVLEHDISLSRSDRYFADPLPFNETVWAETWSYFTTPMITVEQLARARMGRLETSRRTNPEYSLNALGSGFSWGECASFFEIMADGTTGNVDKRYIDYWLRTERLPTEIGWRRRTTTMKGSERTEFSRLLIQAAGPGANVTTGS